VGRFDQACWQPLVRGQEYGKVPVREGKGGSVRLWTLGVAIILFAGEPAFSQAFKCTALMRSGFRFDPAQNRYLPVSSQAMGAGYLLHKYKDGKWYWSNLSTSLMPSGVCEERNFNEYGWMHCATEGVYFNRNSLRYQAASLGDPPFIEVGRCIQCKSSACAGE
jgi:hypothetical protein